MISFKGQLKYMKNMPKRKRSKNAKHNNTLIVYLMQIPNNTFFAMQANPTVVK